MFTLLNPPPLVKEFDGKVNFYWLPKCTSLDVQATEQNCFLELRLGYPICDLNKIMTIKGDVLADDEYVISIKKGWNSYFVPLKPGNSSSSIMAIFSHGMQVVEDSRFLGAMLSYAAITDDTARIERISSVDREIEKALAMCDASRDRREWLNNLIEEINNNASELYAQKSLPAFDVVTPEDDAMASMRVEYKKEILLSNCIEDSASVLEIGCGKGSMSFLTKRGINLVGFDLSEKNCNEAFSRGYSACQVASAESIPFPDESFDYVISADVFGHIARAKKEQCVKEIFRVLKKRGKTIHFIETDNFDPDIMEPVDFARMVMVDGHIGIISSKESEVIFAKYFRIEKSMMIGNSFMSAWHWLRAHDLYGDNLPGEMVSFILNANKNEIDAFNLGNGIAFWRSLHSGLNSMASGGMLFIICRKE